MLQEITRKFAAITGRAFGVGGTAKRIPVRFIPAKTYIPVRIIKHAR